jgi:hypothetical protein
MTRRNTERPSFKAALGPPPPPPPVALTTLTTQVPATTKRALKLAAVERGTTVRALVDHALTIELGLAGLETENQQLREAIADLLPAWLNHWDPGKNQDIIDRAEALIEP